MVAVRVLLRGSLTILLLPTLPLLAVPLPGRSHVQRRYCRIVLRCLGIRITVSGGPIRNVPGVLVVSGHVSWVDIFAIGAVMPGAFVAKAEMVGWPGLGTLAKMMRVIPIDRDNLRRLPEVVSAVAARLRAGRTVVAFPEGTTWCGLAYGPFRPAMFQAAIDAGRPVQPLRLSYHHRDGSRSTVASYIGDDTLLTSICRLVTARRTVVHVRVESLQLPGEDRRDLAARCEAAVRGDATRSAPLTTSACGEGHALVA
jgi:1-acyl-sn-glycerol-3-phosphate acyltransferase